MFGLPFQTKSLQKYYKFWHGPPVNYNYLHFIFAGSIATEKWRYASTQSPSNSVDEENNVDLNIPSLVIIDLIKSHYAPASSKRKGKLKRSSCPLQCSHSNKCSHTDEKIVLEKFSEWDSIRSDYLEKCMIGDSLFYKPSANQFPEENVMDIINHLAIEIKLPLKAYVRTCRKLKSSSWVRIVLKMSEDGIDEWLLNFIRPSNNWWWCLLLMFSVICC